MRPIQDGLDRRRGLEVCATHPQLNIETLRQAQGWLWGSRAGGIGYGLEGGEGCG